MREGEGEDKAWLDWRARFSEIYDEANYVSPIQSWVMRSSHKASEKRFGTTDKFSRVLEIGAGTGEHVKHIRHDFDEYVLSDLDPHTLEVAKKKLGNSLGDRLRFDVQSGATLTYTDNSFDRVVATHVLEHIFPPHLAIKEWVRVLKHRGVLSILIPTDPGLAWRAARHLGPRKSLTKKGLAYDYIMAREHVNACNNLIAFLRHYFPSREESWWPLPVPSIDANLFFVCHVTVNKGE